MKYQEPLFHLGAQSCRVEVSPECPWARAGAVWRDGVSGQDNLVCVAGTCLVPSI